MNIIVIGPPRTGGVTLCKELFNLHPGIRSLGEGLGIHYTAKQILANYKYAKSASSTILKLQPHDASLQATKHNLTINFEELFPSSVRYFTTRKSFEKQCHSYYVAFVTREFGDKASGINKITVNTDQYIKMANYLLNEWKMCIDLYHRYGGIVKHLEKRIQEPYVHNKSHTIHGEWPDISSQIVEFEKITTRSNLFNAPL